MDNVIEEVKRKIDLVEFISMYVPIKKVGRNYKSPCPFHNEKTPSFVVSPERQLWHCFGACGDGGDVVKFLMKWEHITFFEALKELASKAGVEFKQVSFEDKEWQQKDRLIRINQLSAQFYEYILHNSKFGKIPLEYLAKRGVNDKIIKTFQLGYAPESWDSLLNFLRKRNFSDQDIYDAGLVVRNDSGRVYDRFRGRLMFPIKDMRGNIIAFGGRLLDKDPQAAKYINTPESPIYHKRESLFGIHLAKDAIKKLDNVVLVEGEFDMITPYQHGVENIVAIKGAAVTREQLDILKRLTKKITLALDSDAAGEEAIKRGIQEAEKQEFETSVVTFDFGKDPDEAVRNDEIKFKKALKEPIPVYDFLISMARKKHPGDSPFEKQRLGDEVVPFIAAITNPIVQSYYVRKVAAMLNVSEDSFTSLIKKFLWKKRQFIPFQMKYSSQQKPAQEDTLEKFVLSTLLQHDNPIEFGRQIFVVMEPEDFSQVSYQKIAKVFQSQLKDGTYQAQTFVSSLPAELQSVCNELYLYNSNELETTNLNVAKIGLRIKKRSLLKKITELSAEAEMSPESEHLITSAQQMLIEVEKKLTSV